MCEESGTEAVMSISEKIGNKVDPLSASIGEV